MTPSNAPPRTARTHSFARRQWGSLRKLVFRLRHGGDTFTARYFGVRFRCTLDDGVTKGIAANTYDHRQLTRLVRLAGRERVDLFLDIGANLGLYSAVLAARTTIPEIVAFEPDRGNRARLEETVAANGFGGRIRIEPCALGAEPGEAMIAEGPAGNRGTSRLEEGDGPGEEGRLRYPVPVRRLDDLVERSGARILVKIDVEGYEPQVLAGMTRLLARNRVDLQIEAFGTGYEETLRALGYVKRATIANDHFWTGGPEIAGRVAGDGSTR